jgi:hypothetical protein
MTTEPTKEIIEARRRFLQQCGKFSVATPPVVALLLATADRSYAAVRSGGPSHQNQYERGNERGGDRQDRGGDRRDGPKGGR